MTRDTPSELATFLAPFDATIAATKARWIAEYLDAALAHVGVAHDAGDGGTTIRVSRGSKRCPR